MKNGGNIGHVHVIKKLLCIILKLDREEVQCATLTLGKLSPHSRTKSRQVKFLSFLVNLKNIITRLHGCFELERVMVMGHLEQNVHAQGQASEKVLCRHDRYSFGKLIC